MNADWEEVTLGELGSFKNGANFNKNHYGDAHPVINVKNLFRGRFATVDGLDKLSANALKRVEEYFVKRNDILFARSSVKASGAGQVALVRDFENGTIFSGFIIRFRPHDDRLNPMFLYYLLRSPVYRELLTRIATGTTISNLSQSTLAKLPIQLPSRQRQDQIVGLLDAVDSKSEHNHQINQTLEQMAQAIFKSWFVDFEPVKAKIAALEAGGSEEDALLAAMQAISGKGEAELARLQTKQPEQYAELRATAELFPAAMQDSELGHVPNGWEVGNLSSAIDILNGFAFKSGDYVDSPGTFVLRTKNFNSGGFAERLPDDVFLPDNFKVSHKKYLCEAYDYHLVMVGASVGKTSIIFPNETPALRNQNMWCFRPKLNSKIGKAFTKHIVDEVVQKMQGLASGSAREFFRKGDFQKQQICFATKPVQDAFHALVFPLMASQAQNLAQNGALSELRDSILPKLLSGGLSISDAKDQLAEEAEQANV